MSSLKLYRRRYIPDEKILLKDDEILFSNEYRIITKWRVLKKRPDFSHGASCIFLKEGFKVSKFIDENENILYWYCDIVNHDYDRLENTYVINDLLIDIVVQDNGNVKVLDMDEVANALEKKIISTETACEALRKANKLLGIIYGGKFGEYTKYLNNI